jgi:hypothetical protein
LKTVLLWVLSIVGLVLVVAGLVVLVTGDSSWLGSSPEVDTGPPARIAGALLIALGLVSRILALFLFRRSS